MTAPGIGASGILGVAFEALLPPVQNAATTGGAGTVAAGTYRYLVTALNANGETNVSNEISFTAAGATAVNVNWVAVAGATGYNIYRTAVGGGAGTELKIGTVGAVTTFSDPGSVTPTGAFPTVNSASNPGTYVAPVKFIPILSESLKYMQDTIWRRPIRGTAAIVGALPGDVHIEGDIQFEVTSDTLIYFLRSMRTTLTKTGVGPFTYIFTPSSNAVAAKTLSITVVRNGIVFGYLGCAVSQLSLELQNEELIATVSILGLSELVQTLPSATWPTNVPFSSPSYSLQIPTATQIFDTDTFQLQVNDNGVVADRITSSQAGQFVYYGESEGTLTIARDFMARTEYDTFKTLTSKSITLVAANSGSDQVVMAMVTSIIDTYEVDLTAQGDLVRGSITYQLAIDGTGKHYAITCITQTESIF